MGQSVVTIADGASNAAMLESRVKELEQVGVLTETFWFTVMGSSAFHGVFPITVRGVKSFRLVEGCLYAVERSSFPLLSDRSKQGG